MDGTAPVFTLLVALVTLASFVPLIWSAITDRVTSMNLNADMNREAIQARADADQAWEAEAAAWRAEQDAAAWEAEAAEWMSQLRRQATVVVAEQPKQPPKPKPRPRPTVLRVHRVGVAVDERRLAAIGSFATDAPVTFA